VSNYLLTSFDQAYKILSKRRQPPNLRKPAMFIPALKLFQPGWFSFCWQLQISRTELARTKVSIPSLIIELAKYYSKVLIPG
jgi:hypothetical protein